MYSSSKVIGCLMRPPPWIWWLAPAFLDLTCIFGFISLIKAMLPIRELLESEGVGFDSAFVDSTLKILLNLATNELFFFIKKYKRKKSALSNCHEKFFFWIYYLDVHPYSIFTYNLFQFCLDGCCFIIVLVDPIS